MALTKRTYTDFDEDTPITAQNLNDIQDEIIALSNTMEQTVKTVLQTLTAEQKSQARANIEAGTHVVTFSGVSALPTTIADPLVIETMKPINIEVSNTNAMGSEWTVTPFDGGLTLSGTIISGQTTNVIVSLEHTF